MTTSSFSFSPGDMQHLMDSLLKAYEDVPAKAADFLWQILITSLKAHPFAILLCFLIILAVAMFKAMVGYWGTLGSVIYNFLYFGILFIVGWIWGPEVFVADWFHAACTVLLYPICYRLTGYILRKMRFID